MAFLISNRRSTHSAWCRMQLNYAVENKNVTNLNFLLPSPLLPVFTPHCDEPVDFSALKSNTNTNFISVKRVTTSTTFHLCTFSRERISAHTPAVICSLRRRTQACVHLSFFVPTSVANTGLRVKLGCQACMVVISVRLTYVNSRNKK